MGAHYRIRITAFIAFATLALFGCAGEKPQQHAKARAGPNRLIRRLESDVNTLNYVLHTTDYEHYVLQYLYDPLIDLDADLRPIPGLATKWEIGDDGRSYTLHLEPRATFDDGTPLRASDVLFTIHKMLSANSPQFSSWFEGLDAAATKALDEHTVRVVFKEPLVSRLYSFNIGVLPEHVYAKGNFATDFNERAVGCGPYRLARREAGREVTLARRDDYWRARPPIAEVIFRVIADDQVAWKAMQRGDIDETRIASDLWLHEKDRPELRGRIAFYSIYQANYNCFPWNEHNPLFADARVRRALAMAFDRDGIIARMYHGQARAMSGPFTPDLWANDPSVRPTPYDPAAASKLLADAGWRDTNGDGVVDRGGKKFEFDISYPAGNKACTEQTQILQESLKRIGVMANVAPADAATFFDRAMKGEYQSACLAWTIDPDPDPYPLFHSTQAPPRGLNIVGYSNPLVDQLLVEGRTEFDPAKRTAIYHRLNQILAADQPYLWTVQPSMKWAVSTRVKGVRVARGFGLFSWWPGAMGWRVEGR
jgi:peptide/nickel transport system substrate-binding protein